MWEICLALVPAFWLLFAGILIHRLRTPYRKKRFWTIVKCLFVTAFVSSFVLMIPVYYTKYGTETGWDSWRAFFMSVQHALRLFVFDGDFGDIVDFVEGLDLSENTEKIHLFLTALHYLVAPLLTFGFVLSFFKNIFAYLRYLFAFAKNIHVFSELNEKSFALAKSLIEKNKSSHRFAWFYKPCIVFTDVIDSSEEENSDLIEDAKEMGAILFRKDLESIRYRNRFSMRKLHFYLIADDETEKIRHATDIMTHYDYKNVFLYLFSDDIRSELLLSAKNQKNMRVVRINDIQSLIYHNLDKYGIRLFQNAKANNGTISAVIVGMGKYGLETLKALIWYCQFPGFKLKINVFDSDNEANEKFKAISPEIMEKNGVCEAGEAFYDISIKGGVDVKTNSFLEELKQVDATYVLVCLGEDDTNISTAINIRTLYEREGKSPDIETVVYDSDISGSMGMEWTANIDDEIPNEGIKNFKGQAFRIHMIGSLDEFYSADTLPLNGKPSEESLIEEGKQLDDFWGEQSKADALQECDILEDVLACKEEDIEKYILDKLCEFQEKFKLDVKEMQEGETVKERLELCKPLISDNFALLECECFENRLAGSFEEYLEKKIYDFVNQFKFKIQEIQKEKTLQDRLTLLKSLIKNNSTFWRFEYNYKSSVAQALHRRLRRQIMSLDMDTRKKYFTAIGTKSAETMEKENFNGCTEADFYAYVLEKTKTGEAIKDLKEKIKTYKYGEEPLKSIAHAAGMLDHTRWNAYMRTEGYIKGERNDLAKRHHDLVSEKELSDKERLKDI